jgi:hypothetical protein
MRSSPGNKKKAMTRNEIACKYGIDIKTFKRWCIKENIDLGIRSILTPKIIAEIIGKFGEWE